MADVVTGQFNRKKQILQWTAIIVIVIFVGAGAGAGVRWFQQRHHQVPAQIAKKPLAKADVSQNLALSGDYTGAQQQIATALKAPNVSNKDKYALYYQQGANYQNQGDNQAALASFKQAAAIERTESIYESMARVSVALGDNASAISYYKTAIQLVSPNNPLGPANKQSDEQKIRDLGGQP